MVASRQQINKAVKNGLAWLKSRQNKDGSYGKWGLGSTCLATLALVQSNSFDSDPAVNRAIAYILNAKPPDSCYFRALTIMALIANGIKTPDILNRVQSDAAWLVDCQGSNPANYLLYGSWGETRNAPQADNSNMQLAMLALYLATLWDIALPQQIWNRAMDWYQRNYRIKNDGSYTFSLGESPGLYRQGVLYTMTAAAVSGLKIISLLSLDPQVQVQAKSLIGHALNWLTVNYTVDLSPHIEDSWYYYYLYSLLLGCVIEPRFTFIGTNDWYTDAADALVSLQKADGRWISETDKKSTDIVHTSFALLTLTQAGVFPDNEAPGGKADGSRNKHLEVTEEKRRKILAGKARFPMSKTLDAFDFKHSPRINRLLMEQLGEGDFIAAGENVIFIGNPGTGKTHLAIALGMEACNKGFKVRFYTAAELVDNLVTARLRGRYWKMLKVFDEIDLLIIDELSYLTLSRPNAELLFQVISARNEKGSLIITSNLDFTEWTEIFGDPMLTAAIVDRMNYKAHVIDTHGPSYRQKQRL